MLLTTLINAAILLLAAAVAGANGVIAYAVITGVIGLRPYIVYTPSKRAAR